MMRMRSDYGLPFGTEHAHHQPNYTKQKAIGFSSLRCIPIAFAVIASGWRRLELFSIAPKNGFS
jgi:hypothetical protein